MLKLTLPWVLLLYCFFFSFPFHSKLSTRHAFKISYKERKWSVQVSKIPGPTSQQRKANMGLPAVDLVQTLDQFHNVDSLSIRTRCYERAFRLIRVKVKSLLDTRRREWFKEFAQPSPSSNVTILAPSNKVFSTVCPSPSDENRPRGSNRSWINLLLSRELSCPLYMERGGNRPQSANQLAVYTSQSLALSKRTPYLWNFRSLLIRCPRPDSHLQTVTCRQVISTSQLLRVWNNRVDKL